MSERYPFCGEEFTFRQEPNDHVTAHCLICHYGIDAKRTERTLGSKIHDLPYKLNQLARWLLDRGEGQWSEVANAAGHEIVRLLGELEGKHEPGPATKAAVDAVRAYISFWEHDRHTSGETNVLTGFTLDQCRAFIAEWEDQ